MFFQFSNYQCNAPKRKALRGCITCLCCANAKRDARKLLTSFTGGVVNTAEFDIGCGDGA